MGTPFRFKVFSLCTTQFVTHNNRFHYSQNGLSPTSIERGFGKKGGIFADNKISEIHLFDNEKSFRYRQICLPII